MMNTPKYSMETTNWALACIAFCLLQVVRCSDISSITVPARMQIGRQYTIRWSGGNQQAVCAGTPPRTIRRRLTLVKATYIYVATPQNGNPILISSPSVRGNEFNWTPSEVFPPMAGYSIGVTQNLSPDAGLTYSRSIDFTNDFAAPAIGQNAQAQNAQATFTNPLINPATATANPRQPIPATESPADPPAFLLPPASSQSTDSSRPQGSSRSGDSLSAGATAGIIVGVVVGVALIGGLGFIVGRRLTRARTTPAREVKRTLTGGFIPGGSLEIPKGEKLQRPPSYAFSPDAVGNRKDVKRKSSERPPMSLRPIPENLLPRSPRRTLGKGRWNDPVELP